MSRFTTPSVLTAVLAVALTLSSAPARSQPLRLSTMGPDGDPAFGVHEQIEIAYNPVDGEYLVVWSGFDDRDGQVAGEIEVFVQRVDAATGAEVGVDDLRISAFGGLGEPASDTYSVDVAYNPDAHEFLAVWETLVAGVYGPLFGRRIDASTGIPISAEIDLSAGAQASSPSVAYNPATEEYLVAWSSDDAPGVADGEYEIFVRRLAGSTATPLGDGGTRISTMGPDLDPEFDALTPDVAADDTFGRYLVVWQARVPGGDGIFAQAVTGLGVETGVDDRQLSNVDPRRNPRIAYNPLAGASGEYLAVWARDGAGIYGRRINAASLIPYAGDELLLSGLAGGPGASSDSPTVAARSDTDGWTVAWRGRDPDLAPFESEIFATSVGPLGGTTGRIRISEAGGTGDADWVVSEPAIAAAPSDSAYVVWPGEDNQGGMVNGEFEAFGRALALPIFFDGFESATTAAWTAAVAE